MSSALPVLYERNLRSALPHVTLARRGCLILCVGRSEGVRARVEDALAERLGVGKVLVRGSLAEQRTDLWRVMVDARNASGAKPEDTVLSFRLAGEKELETERLFGLNVGREIRSVERLRLLLWLDGFAQFEALRDKAPDLWAVRTDVQFYVSREDFEVPNVGPPHDGLDKEIREIDDWLQKPWIGIEQRIALIVTKARRTTEQRRYQETSSLLDEAQRLIRRAEVHGEIIDSATRARAFAEQCLLLTRLNRFSESRRLGAEAAGNAATDGDAWLGYAATGRLGEVLWLIDAFGAAITAYSEQERYYEQLLENGRVSHSAWAVFVNRARVRATLGQPAYAEMDVGAANHEFPSADEEDSWRGLLREFLAELLLAQIARLRGRTIEELTHAHRSSARAVEIQAWHRVAEALCEVAATYQRMGLADEARRIANQALARVNSQGAPLDHSNWHVRLGDLVRDAGDLVEAKQHYALAVDLLRARPSDAEQAALAAIEEAHIHATNWPEVLPPDEAAAYREKALHLLQDVLRQPVSIDRHMEAHLALGKLHRTTKRFDDSVTSLTTYRDWARTEQGPARAARASIELARTSLARGNASEAIAHLAAARADLEREEPLHRSRFVQKEILVVLHEAHVAAGDLAAAHADLAEALSVVRADGLRLEELDALQLLGELLPAAGAADHRLAAAREAAAIARETLWPAEEARALRTLAALELDARNLHAARAAFEEATWIADSVGPASLREKLRELGTRL